MEDLVVVNAKPQATRGWWVQILVLKYADSDTAGSAHCDAAPVLPSLLFIISLKIFFRAGLQ